MAIRPLTVIPQRGGSPDQFSIDQDTYHRVDLPNVINDINAVLPSIDAASGYATTAAASAAIAAASANFKGAWSGLTGPLALPASVSTGTGADTLTWMLLQPLADVTTQPPSFTNTAYWLCLNPPPALFYTSQGII